MTVKHKIINIKSILHCKKAADSTVNAVRGLLDLPNSPCCPVTERKNHYSSGSQLFGGNSLFSSCSSVKIIKKITTN